MRRLAPGSSGHATPSSGQFRATLPQVPGTPLSSGRVPGKDRPSAETLPSRLKLARPTEHAWKRLSTPEQRPQPGSETKKDKETEHTACAQTTDNSAAQKQPAHTHTRKHTQTSKQANKQTRHTHTGAHTHRNTRTRTHTHTFFFVGEGRRGQAGRPTKGPTTTPTGAQKPIARKPVRNRTVQPRGTGRAVAISGFCAPARPARKKQRHNTQGRSKHLRAHLPAGPAWGERKQQNKNGKPKTAPR